MKVISLSPRRKGLSLLTFEDGSELAVDSEVVLSEGITSGSEVENIDDLRLLSDTKRAKSRALWYLSRSDHAAKALTDKLLRGGFCEEAVRTAVERMEELGLVNDEAYARRLAESLLSSGVSRKEAVYKLMTKGIGRDLAKQAVEEQDADDGDAIKTLLARKYAAKLQTEDGVRKVFAALQRKGFSFSDIKSALKQYSEELSDCEDDYGI